MISDVHHNHFWFQKTRFTAYMLWAKEIRQEILRVNPDMGMIVSYILVDHNASTSYRMLKIRTPNILNTKCNIPVTHPSCSLKILYSRSTTPNPTMCTLNCHLSICNIFMIVQVWWKSSTQLKIILERYCQSTWEITVYCAIVHVKLSILQLNIYRNCHKGQAYLCCRKSYAFIHVIHCADYLMTSP
jgi:hypothetical protein